MNIKCSSKHDRNLKKSQCYIVIHNSNIDLGCNSNSNMLIFKVIHVVTLIVLYYTVYTDFGGISNSNSNILH